MEHPPPFWQDYRMDAAAPGCSPTRLIPIPFRISPERNDGARSEVPHKAAHFVVALYVEEVPHGFKGEAEAVSCGGGIGLGGAEYGIHLSVGVPYNPYARKAA